MRITIILAAIIVGTAIDNDFLITIELSMGFGFVFGILLTWCGFADFSEFVERMRW